ncbi:hypothetical protein [Gracilibacillus halophilus]|uniref:hypothetical protein n=1 Tax=Gracilibacillus halophilus TaxID=470864 RepID=UPI00039A0634|nr:hypothetical protein [Gracilibacillus halophilus]
MKRIYVLLFCSFVFLLLVACSSDNSGEDVTMPDDPEEVSGDITVWAWALEAIT